MPDGGHGRKAFLHGEDAIADTGVHRIQRNTSPIGWPSRSSG